MNPKNRIETLTLVMLVLLTGFLPRAYAANADDLMAKAIAHFEKGGVELEVALDDMAEMGVAGNAVVRMDRERFTLKADGNTIWFDGKTQWTLRTDDSGAGSELYIGEPTEEDLQAVNPYILMKNYRRQYVATEAPATALPKGATSCVRLQNRDSRADIQDALVYLDGECRLVALTATVQGTTVSLTVRSFRTGMKFKDADFTCRVKDYDAEVIDLR